MSREATSETLAVSNYQRTTTRSRREANKPRYSHYSKWIDVVPDANGEPEYRVHFKTKVLTREEKHEKLMKRKWFRNLPLVQLLSEPMNGPFDTASEALQDALEEAAK